MSETINFEDLKKRIDIENRKRTIKEKVFSKLNKGKEMFIENKENIIKLTPVVVGGLATLFKVVNKRRNLNKQEEIKKLYCYDRSLGHYWELRRELSNREWLEIDARKKNGERLSDILSDLKVLK